MQNNKLIKWLILAAVVISFITGWFTKPAGSVTNIQTVKIHDTLKTSALSYKILPGVNYNIDSLTNSINQFWKDSLKSLYGKGLFQAKYLKEDELGKRKYTLSSRIPIDPESNLIVNENFVMMKRSYGIKGGISLDFVSLGLKYYVVDTGRFLLSFSAQGNYLMKSKEWIGNGLLEAEFRF